ncbi:hypothetical protein [Alteromonas facilis]|uniref:hypothetical protein n=1 Tax=Alteromonas facilis TaxID=2048004 RepID=UPI000C288C83|nr:hypothetical protein [Alteromonas facilis]
MADWLNAVLFGIALIALVLGLSSIIMGFLSDKTGAEALKERIEYGYLGVSGVAIFGLLGYLLL